MLTAAPELADAPSPQDRPVPLLDGESAAWGLSLLLHLTALAALAAATLVIPSGAPPVDLSLETVDLVDPEALTQEFVSTAAADDEVGALASGGAGGALASAADFSEQSVVTADADLLAEMAERPAAELDVEMATAPELTSTMSVQGAGAVGTTGAEGAIDRLTHEILASLEQRPTLVVWLFDQSGSLREERARIVKRFRRIYEELGVIEAARHEAFRRHQDKPLLTVVAGFGAAPRLLTQEPTDRIEEIEAAVKSIADDQSGQENVFQAILMAAEKFRTYRSAKNGKRHVMIVVFTDEAGDDMSLVDETVNACRKYAMPVYVVGRPAPFGRQTAYVKWIDPDPRFDQRPQWVPVTLGPETVMPEVLKLRLAERGDEEELLDSGFGPYALTRLCYETGGLYFTVHPNREVGRRISGDETSNLAAHFTAFFDGDAMRRYQPDYIPTAEYLHRVQSNAARRALIQAAQMSWTSPMENVRLRFPKRDEAELAQALSLAQRSAALLQPKIDQICQILLAGEEERPRLREPRWQAGYDLALGRALAVKVRTDGYNIMLAQAKHGMPFQNQKNNTWVLRADEHFAVSGLEKTAEKARYYLETVLREHPGTPWALLAERELASPLGWRWHEDYTYIPPPAEPGENRPPNPEPPRQGPPRRDPPPL